LGLKSDENERVKKKSADAAGGGPRRPGGGAGPHGGAQRPKGAGRRPKEGL